MLAGFELQEVWFHLYQVVILVEFFDGVDERSPVLIVHCCISKPWDHVKPSVDPHSCHLLIVRGTNCMLKTINLACYFSWSKLVVGLEKEEIQANKDRRS